LNSEQLLDFNVKKKSPREKILSPKDIKSPKELKSPKDRKSYSFEKSPSPKEKKFNSPKDFLSTSSPKETYTINKYKTMKDRQSSPNTIMYERPRSSSLQEYKVKFQSSEDLGYDKKVPSISISHDTSSPKSRSESNSMLVSPRTKFDYNSREILLRIKQNQKFRSIFEQNLTKTNTLSSWKFWEELTEIVEFKSENNDLSLKFKELYNIYLDENSANHVNTFNLSYSFYLNVLKFSFYLFN
jgi:hypothetical protein